MVIHLVFGYGSKLVCVMVLGVGSVCGEVEWGCVFIMILSRHYLVCLFNIIHLAISFCESMSSCLYAFSCIC